MKASKTAKIFMNGNSQAVRLPQEFRFEGKEVYIRKEGDQVILSPKKSSWRDFFENAPLASEDFMETRDDELHQEREDLF
jgi:antitoxin VapB